MNDDRFSAKEKVIQMVKATCESDIYVNYPIIVMNTMDDEVLVIEKGDD